LWHEYFTERVRGSCLGLLISIPKIPGASQMYEILNTYASKKSAEKEENAKKRIADLRVSQIPALGVFAICS
jgi:hypothetical protein